MPKRITVATPTDKNIQHMARIVLDCENPIVVNHEVLDAIIKIAHDEKLDVEFVTSDGKTVDPDLAYRLRYERGLDLNPR